MFVYWVDFLWDKRHPINGLRCISKHSANYKQSQDVICDVILKSSSKVHAKSNLTVSDTSISESMASSCSSLISELRSFSATAVVASLHSALSSSFRQ